ncbi:hypothetical protein AB7M32_003294 [Pseudomonas sp. R151218B TE3479]
MGVDWAAVIASELAPTGFIEHPLPQNGTATVTWLYTLVPLPVT